MRLSIVSLLILLSVGNGFSQAALNSTGAVHEWGTFTSVAGEDGSAMAWRPLYGPSDLPCFVHHLDQQNLKLADYGTVRMETPVIYFYPLKPLTVTVHVGFPEGRVTEWYPQASAVQTAGTPNGWIEWKNVLVSRGGGTLPKLDAASHYYAARQTNSWFLQSEGEEEKLLFYRGIAYFSVDLRPVVQADGVSLHNNSTETVPSAVLFENHAGRIGYKVIHGLRDPVNIKFAELSGSVNDLRTKLAEELTEMGLYHEEARAMLETWRDSWFEEGLRVFYILPRRKVDQLLPISIEPAPEQVARVFVGRVELLSPSMRSEISAALKSGDTAMLKKYGRFLDAFLHEMGGEGMDQRARQLLNHSDRQIAVESKRVSCGQ
jgi:hypothetical protein